MPKAPLPVKTVLECWAPWCGASHRMAMQLTELAAELEPHIAFSRLNADEMPETLGEFQVRVLPTLLFLDTRGLELARLEGECGRAEIEATLDAHAAARA